MKREGSRGVFSLFCSIGIHTGPEFFNSFSSSPAPKNRDAHFECSGEIDSPHKTFIILQFLYPYYNTAIMSSFDYTYFIHFLFRFSYKKTYTATLFTPRSLAREFLGFSVHACNGILISPLLSLVCICKFQARANEDINGRLAAR